MTVSNVIPVSGGFAFDASWPKHIPHGDWDNSRLELATTLAITCGDGATQTVTAVTHVDTCITREGFVWIGSGGSCTYCQHPPSP